MPVPVIGSTNYRILIELQKQICYIFLILDKLGRIDRSESASTSTDERQICSALQGMSDYALVMHLDRLRRWAVFAKRKELIGRQLGQRLRSLSKDITFLRGKREHSEEYLDGDKRRASLQREVVNNNCAVLTPADWSSTINGVRKLGGRLVVSDVPPAVRELFDELIAADLWVLSWRPEALVQTDRALVT